MGRGEGGVATAALGLWMQLERTGEAERSWKATGMQVLTRKVLFPGQARLMELKESTCSEFSCFSASFRILEVI